MAPGKPDLPRAVAFVDGQNLFNAAKEAFFPNYDVVKLSLEVASSQGWSLVQARFYTGIPEPNDPQHVFWGNRLASLGRQGVVLFSRPLRYHLERSRFLTEAYSRQGSPSRRAWMSGLLST